MVFIQISSSVVLLHTCKVSISKNKKVTAKTFKAKVIFQANILKFTIVFVVCRLTLNNRVHHQLIAQRARARSFKAIVKAIVYIWKPSMTASHADEPWQGETVKRGRITLAFS